MRLLRNATEDEMVLAFLRQESESPRFRENVLDALKNAGAGEALIREGDPDDGEQNKLRRRVLGFFRGYPDREIFANYPTDAVWKYGSFEAEDLERLRYVDYDYWNGLSGGTSSPIRAAEAVRQGKEVFGVSNAYFLKGRDELARGKRFPPLIVMTCGNGLYLLLEGHCRATAYALLPEAFAGTEAYVGFCSEEAMRRKEPGMFSRG